METKNKESCSHDHRITRISWKDNYSISECQKCKIVWNEETGEVIKRP